MAPARQSQLACTQLGQGRGAGAGPQLIGRRADDLEIEIEAVGLSSLQDRTCWRALEPRWRITGRHAQRMLFSFVTRWCPRQRASSVSPRVRPIRGIDVFEGQSGLRKHKLSMTSWSFCHIKHMFWFSH